MGTHPTARVHPLRMALANAYLVKGPKGIVLVDAGAWPDHRAILRQTPYLTGGLRLIIITHAHLDHYGGAGALRRATGAPIAIHVADAAAMSQGQTPIRSARGIGMLLKPFLPLANLVFGPEPTTPDLLLTDGQDLGSYLGCEARVLHTPGHTPGSICRTSLLALSRQEPQVTWPGHGRYPLTTAELLRLAQGQAADG